MEKTNRTPAEHIASLPAERRADVERLDALITDLMAGQPKTVWEGRLWGGEGRRSSISFSSIDNVDLDQLSELIVEAKRLMT